MALDPLWTRANDELRENVDYIYNVMSRIDSGYDDWKEMGPHKLQDISVTAKVIEK